MAPRYRPLARCKMLGEIAVVTERINHIADIIDVTVIIHEAIVEGLIQIMLIRDRGHAVDSELFDRVGHAIGNQVQAKVVDERDIGVATNHMAGYLYCVKTKGGL